MQNKPSETDIGLSETIHQRGNFVQHKLFSHHTLSQVFFALCIAFILFQSKFVCQFSNALSIQNVRQSHVSCFVRFPPIRQIDDVS